MIKRFYLCSVVKCPRDEELIKKLEKKEKREIEKDFEEILKKRPEVYEAVKNKCGKDDLIAWKGILEEVKIPSGSKVREEVTRFFLSHGPYYLMEMGALYEFVKIMSKTLNIEEDKIIAILWGLQKEYGLEQTKSWLWGPLNYRFKKYREWMQAK